MTKEEVLQKVNDYCNEKSYTSSTLTDGFKDKFADHFQKLNAEGDIEDETVLANLKFAINTAFSSSSAIITEKQKAFEAKENDYKSQIADLNKKLGKKDDDKDDESEAKLAKELKDKLDELEKFKVNEQKSSKFKNIIKIAKGSVRQDLHKSFDAFAESFDASLEIDDKEQADKLVERFQAIFRDSLGDIKPLAPRQVKKNEEEFISSIPKVTIE